MSTSTNCSSNNTANHKDTRIKTKIFMLDNLDSFTYNLVDEFYQLGFELVIYRNTVSADFIVEQIEQHCQQEENAALVVLSPGPGTPTDAGCLMDLIAKTAGKYPILGICLGHQALVQHYGGIVGRAPEIMHGKSSLVSHTGTGAFANISQPLPVARYHSLAATTMPESLSMIADYQGLPMAVEHSQDAALGFQFHPESVLTTYGSNLLAQSIDYLLALQSNKCHRAQEDA
ncbi:aminodeoxychorismate/anthranilate synthase component II [Endozoicomonas sp. G2_1]|uniref:aminodeoxychorismate/anthranilate synthase component II n=1 Tax=Endozoicomonas sp. G2_1 TaxID=2821091 RepID=UPI001ADB8883|nr:aminodeoxychorismate/anthranilate synthase component II [Endozoicomonas sp. G2_1]MBO9491479.1 aminodeoxychorismate/anthranilate synthase component II [Endozoicomonas sp. G2_1]